MFTDHSTWRRIGLQLARHPPGTVWRIEKHLVPHPEDDGLQPSIGLPIGQSADFRLRLPNCLGLHVHDFGRHYQAHVDRVHPDCGVVEHLRRDAPEAYLTAGVALGALLGALLGKKSDAVLAGAALGGLLAGVGIAADSRQQKAGG